MFGIANMQYMELNNHLQEPPLQSNSTALWFMGEIVCRVF